MKASELRIGNATKQGIIKNFWEKGAHIGFGKCYEFEELQEIELTEEILLRCGFKELENQPRKWFKIKTKKRGVSLEICFSSKRIILNNGYDFVDLLYIKYLHQLQNLYFALTNEELTINL